VCRDGDAPGIVDWEDLVDELLQQFDPVNPPWSYHLLAPQSLPPVRLDEVTQHYGWDLPDRQGRLLGLRWRCTRERLAGVAELEWLARQPGPWRVLVALTCDPEPELQPVSVWCFESVPGRWRCHPLQFPWPRPQPRRSSRQQEAAHARILALLAERASPPGRRTRLQRQLIDPIWARLEACAAWGRTKPLPHDHEALAELAKQLDLTNMSTLHGALQRWREAGTDAMQPFMELVLATAAIDHMASVLGWLRPPPVC
jgi:hypothetical protein